MPIRLLLSTVIFFLSLSQLTQARDSTLNYTCHGAKELIRRYGAVVLDTKGPYVYKRFVHNRRWCNLEEVTKRYRVPTRDGWCQLRICHQLNPGAGGR